MSKPLPNIILLMTDQQKASATGAWGNPVVWTPTWDRLAAEGVRFENCYAQSPICTPSRTSLMTGTYPLVHQVYCHQNHAPAGLEQLPEILRNAGYTCVGAGHYESERSLNRGWDATIDLMGTPELEAALKAQYRAGSPEVGWSSGEHHLPPDLAHAAVLNREVNRVLDKVQASTKPLFLHVAYIEPHPPYFAPKGLFNHQRASDLPLPCPGDLHDRPQWHQEALKDYRSDEASGDDLRKMLEAYYTLIEYADTQMGVLLSSLEERGLLDDAWVIALSDHGDYAGEKGFFTKSETPYECLLHVPLVIRGPRGTWKPGTSVPHLVELIDLFPTLLGLAGIKQHQQAQGYDLIGWQQEENPRALRPATFSAVGEYHGSLKTTMPWGLPESGRHAGLVTGVRSHRFSYIDDPDNGPEAYDLRSDPLELHNLVKQGELPNEVEELKRYLFEWKEENLSLRSALDVIPGNRNFDSPPNANLVGSYDKN